eukprot:TRINITY_DN3121_c0_g2_i3.p1 TRINITY_DN3121_c0_g2~~TRINITY_DN3121_c0_g2_i3.p1  ORF type:complete len:103 (+),score=10.51 TRINITY_DN3121_c0_g2_i3:33-341(+)
MTPTELETLMATYDDLWAAHVVFKDNAIAACIDNRGCPNHSEFRNVVVLSGGIGFTIFNNKPTLESDYFQIRENLTEAERSQNIQRDRLANLINRYAAAIAG